MRKPTRRIAAIVSLLALMLFQGSVAAHACMLSHAARGAAAHMPPAAAPSAHGHCEGMADKSAAALCLKHCSLGDDLTGPATIADVPVVVAGTFLVVAPVRIAAGYAGVAALSLAVSGAAPPPLLLSQRLRI
jgi:hypothetical protein